jgi:hypothetical protein
MVFLRPNTFQNRHRGRDALLTSDPQIRSAYLLRVDLPRRQFAVVDVEACASHRQALPPSRKAGLVTNLIEPASVRGLGRFLLTLQWGNFPRTSVTNA